MTNLYRNQIEDEYFNWMYDKVCKNKNNKFISLYKLLRDLHNIEFTFIIQEDINRAIDGTDLRYKFAMYKHDETINDILNDKSCSVLEMMVALSIRCEETIMDDTAYGDRTGQWFWEMMHNLGIGIMTDDIYDGDVVYSIINSFLNRRYKPNGKGGLFYIYNCDIDLRKVPIWTQLCWYLDSFAC